MTTFITIIHVIVCIILIIVVLLQSGKSADLAGAFGGGGSQTIFGPRGAGNILSKLTTACAVIFMFTSIGLWILSAKSTKSVVSGEKAPTEETDVTTTAQEEEKKPAPVSEQQQKKDNNTTEKQNTK